MTGGARRVVVSRRMRTTSARKSSFGLGSGVILLAPLVVLFLNPCTLTLGIRAGVLETFVLDGPSMAPAYQHGDRVVVAKYSYGLFLPFASEASVSWGVPELGDVVIARDPYSGFDIAKRVVGLPGDEIEIRDRAVVRNGTPLMRRELGPTLGGEWGSMRCIEERVGDRAWTILEDDGAVRDTIGPITIPDGHVFLLGDNRDRSNDSRNPRIGPVPIVRLKGRVALRYFAGSSRIECPNAR